VRKFETFYKPSKDTPISTLKLRKRKEEKPIETVLLELNVRVNPDFYLIFDGQSSNIGL